MGRAGPSASGFKGIVARPAAAARRLTARRRCEAITCYAEKRASYVEISENIPEWKGQQKPLWVEVRKKTEKGKNWFKIRDLFADERWMSA